MLVIFIKSGSNLSPIIMLLPVNRTAIAIANMIFKPAAIPVDVDNGIHVLVDNPTHYFRHSVEPCRVNRVVGSVYNVAIPCTRYTHGIEAHSLKSFYIVDIYLCRGPLALAPYTVRSRALHGVADVDAGIHARCNGLGVGCHDTFCGILSERNGS